MKKFYMLVLLFAIIPCSNFVEVKANHLLFQELNTFGEITLENYTDEMYDEHYPLVSKRKFMGYRTHTITDNVFCTFKEDTLFSYHNSGYTPIEYEYTATTTLTSKMSISATGSIALVVKGDVKQFDGNLNTSLKITGEYEKKEEIKEVVKMSFDCDPGTSVVMYISGEGKLTNGVAKGYFFWFEIEKGGFEYFLVTARYQRLEKIKS